MPETEMDLRSEIASFRSVIQRITRGLAQYQAALNEINESSAEIAELKGELDSLLTTASCQNVEEVD